MNYTATYLQHGKIKSAHYEEDAETALNAFQKQMEDINPTWAVLISVDTGKEVDRYSQRAIVGTFEAVAKATKDKYGKCIAAWTDGVSLEQNEKGTSLVTDLEPFSAFRLKEGRKYRIVVTELNT
tara:strand:+ start:276 stop:650 length:375 start_codon:yes stop_codon:yes gene_type:complete